MHELKIPYRFMAAALCLLLMNGDGLMLIAQSAVGQPAATPPRLLITIVDGGNALNNIKQRTAREPIVEVDDQNHRPVAGAAVVFSLPDSGPSGTFLDGTRLFTTVTKADGRAAATGLRPNHIAGKFNIQVKARFQGATTETTIEQTNVTGTAPASGHAFPLKAVLIGGGIAAAGGIVAGLLATRGGHSTTITAGTPTVGAP